MHVFPYDYYADKPVETVGLARTASLIANLRAEATNSLLLDNGDFLQGNPMGDYIAYERGMSDDTLHPMIAAMNAVGFDAATLGNHEFNYGLDFLMTALAGARFPVVSANVIRQPGARPTDDLPLLPPYVILDRIVTDGQGQQHPLRVGVIGFVTPQILAWDRRHLEGRIHTRDIVETARAWVPELRKRGADLVIALSHSGIGAARHVNGMENASVPLATIDGIDAILTGHSHLVFPSAHYDGVAGVDAASGTIHGKPAVMAGSWGSRLGLIDLLLQRENGAWRVLDHRVDTRPIYDRDASSGAVALVDSQQNVLDAVAQDHSRTLSYIRRPVGRTSAPLHSYFALVADDPSVQLVLEAQRWHARQMLQGSDLSDLPLLSAAAPFKAGGRGGPDYYTEVPAGPIAIRNVADLYLYPNTLRVLRITGAQLRDWLERSAGLFHQITPGQRDQPLLHPEFPSYNFDVIDGIRYEIDPSQPSKYDRATGNLVAPNARRIVSLTCQGKPVRDDALFLIATNSYRAGGGGQFPGADGSTVVADSSETTRDVIVRYMVEQGTLRPATSPNWRFAALPGTSVLFDTSPSAAKYADTLAALVLEPAGRTETGFARFRLHL